MSIPVPKQTLVHSLNQLYARIHTPLSRASSWFPTCPLSFLSPHIQYNFFYLVYHLETINLRCLSFSLEIWPYLFEPKLQMVPVISYICVHIHSVLFSAVIIAGYAFIETFNGNLAGHLFPPTKNLIMLIPCKRKFSNYRQTLTISCSSSKRTDSVDFI
jgi:hypothetical protein